MCNANFSVARGNITDKPNVGRKYYGTIDGLRTIAAFGIVMMHMAANNDYAITGFIYETIIPSFTNFVFLFMAISAFGMCCGYYEKFLYGTVSISEFYGKRYKKVFPFFAVLVLVDILISPSVNSLYEGFGDLTLLFGLLPNGGGIGVIGVGWFLGLIFVFYLCFPFFCFLIENRKRAWIAFGISLVYNFACVSYFDVGRQNILYSGCFFLAGGLVYLYRDAVAKLTSKRIVHWILIGITALSIIIYYIYGGNTVTWLLVSVMILIYAVGSSGCNSVNGSGKVLENRITKFFGGISMEIYLSHMLIFRVIEKLHWNTMFGNGWGQYVILVVTVLLGASVFAIVMQKITRGIGRRLLG